YSHAEDDFRDCRDLVRERLGLGDWDAGGKSDTVSYMPPLPDLDQQQRIDFALRLWRQSVDPRGTIVETYLASRGLPLDGDLSHVIRYFPALRLNGSTTPGMVALYRDIRTDEPCGVHRTF